MASNTPPVLRAIAGVQIVQGADADAPVGLLVVVAPAGEAFPEVFVPRAREPLLVAVVVD